MQNSRKKEATVSDETRSKQLKQKRGHNSVSATHELVSVFREENILLRCNGVSSQVENC